MNQSRSNLILLAALAVSGSLNILLSFRVHSLVSARAPTPRIKVGLRLEDITGLDPSGDRVTVRFEDSQTPTVILVLRPGCQWCDANMPNWKTLIAEKRHSFRFVAVSLSPIDFTKYLELNKLNIPGVAPSVEQNPMLNGVSATPQTIVVEHDGTVRKVWLGAYAGDTKRDVEAFFGVRLPVEARVPG